MASTRQRIRRVTAKGQVATGIEVGRALAARALKERAKQRKTREAALRRHARRTRAGKAGVARTIPPAVLKALGSRATAGLLIAEGDSWFDYPFRNVLTKLEDRHGYDVDSVAHNGDRLEDMAYSGAQFADFTRLLEKRLREGKIPRAVLLSAGGNDIAGDELAVLLNHAASGLDALNEDVVRGVIDVRLRTAFTAMLSGVTAIAERYLNRPLPIVVHGYARPVPDGRGYLGGWWKLPGPWLKPSFDLKGYSQGPSTVLIGRLVDRVNDMLAGVSATRGFSHVHYLDLRPLLGNGPRYKDDWANELHPSVRGFDKVADKFAGAIATFPA